MSIFEFILTTHIWAELSWKRIWAKAHKLVKYDHINILLGFEEYLIQTQP